MEGDSLRRHDDVIYKSVTLPKRPVSTPLERADRLAVLVFSIVQLILGISLTALGASINSYSTAYSKQHTPPIWWIGLVPLQLGCFGAFVFLVNHSKKAMYWGVSTIVLSLIQIAVMGLCGNFNTGYYGVWPYAGTREGHPICQYMVETCYCQDYFHGKMSQSEQPEVQYIHTDLKWKDTGYRQCDDVEQITRLYYATIIIFGLNLVTQVCACVFAFVTVFGERKVKFQRLQNAQGDIEECFSSEPEGLMAPRTYRELQQISQ